MIGATRHALAAEVARQSKLSSDIAKLQEQVSSGKRLTAASDDPVAAGRIAAIRRTLADHAVWSRNAETGSTIAASVGTTLSTTASALDRAKELLLAAGSGTSSPNDRTAYAAELRTIAKDVDGYARATDSAGRALFPDTGPPLLPISDSQAVAATVLKGNVFQVTTGAASRSISDILNTAADSVALDDGATMSITGDDGTSRMLARGPATSAAIATLDAAIDHVSVVRTDQGVREQHFAAVKEQLANSDVDLSIERSGLEDTDLTYTLSEMQAKQLSLQAAQTVFAQSRKSNLFDLLG